MRKLLTTLFSSMRASFDAGIFNFMSLNFPPSTISGIWVYSIFFMAFIFIFLKILMFYILGNYFLGKLVFVLMISKMLFTYSSHLYTDFEKSPLSWVEGIQFMLFTLQLSILFFAICIDLYSYLTYVRHRLPCHFFGEFGDKLVENYIDAFFYGVASAIVYFKD